MKRVLIAEDDVFIANAYKTKLESAGAVVEIAEDGYEAMLLIDKFKPDVIVLDLVMPKQDGYETLAMIRADKKYAKIKVIVASNLSQEDEIKRAKQGGADGFLIKSDTPVDKMAETILG